MSINNSRDYLAMLTGEDGYIVTDHLLLGSNLQLAPGTYGFDWDTGELDSVTFKGTAGKDALFGGGGEIYSFFLGTRGDDLYGTNYASADYGDSIPVGYVDYSGASRGVVVDMTFHGSRSFTDASGAVQTVSIIGKAQDGFGGTDYFAESKAPGLEGWSSIFGVFGSSYRDVMNAGNGWAEFYGGRGDDLLIGSLSHGGDGNDRLILRATGDKQTVGEGDAGNDLLQGTDFVDLKLIGGAGNDTIFAGGGDDGSGTGQRAVITGNEGNDYVDGGAGDDFIDGGVGKDVLVSGSGSDIINPDVEYFQTAPNQARDGAKDVILVTQADLGDYTDVVLSRAFEAGRDQIQFKDAVCRGESYRVFTEAQSFNDAGRLLRPDDLADRLNTVLQIDQDHDGFGGTTPDKDDYFLVVLDATLSHDDGFLLT